MKTIFIANKSLQFIILLGIFTYCVSCRKLIEVGAPSTSTNSKVVFSTDATASAVMTGIFAQMNIGLEGINSLSIYPEISGDNLTLFADNNQQYSVYYRNDLSSAYNTLGPVYWSLLYNTIYNINAVIEGAGESKTLTKKVKDRLLGEAYFMRGFSYFYLINLYGNVPLVLTTSYHESENIGRSPIADVYRKIIDDLKQAQSLITEDYVDASLVKPTHDRLRPNKSAVNALLARVYLYMGDYVNAELYATNVIIQKNTYSPVQLDEVFLKNSQETIWALQPMRLGENTPENRFYALPASGPNLALNPVYLSDRLMQSFEDGDNRKSLWTTSQSVSGKDYPYAFKYKAGSIPISSSPSEYSIVLRLAEQYLIRSEARAQLNKINGSQEDLNTIRNRAGLSSTNANTKEELLTAIIKERRWELFTEWGHRWFDLKRTGIINTIMPDVTLEKGGIWRPEHMLYPIPNIEIEKNKNLNQNNGYQ